jgi:mannosyl-oligosaccharide alpha-1,2-mannosidase
MPAPAPVINALAEPQTAQMPADYEEPMLPGDDDLTLIPSSSFPAKFADYFGKSHKSLDQLYPLGNPHQGIIPAPLLARLDREIPQIPPPRPSPASPIPGEAYTPHSGWSSASNGSSTTYLDALQPEKQSIEADWRGAPFNLWKPPLQELASKNKKSLPKVQHTFTDPSRHSGDKNDPERDYTNSYRQKLVKNAFLHSWEGYKSKAWGHDEVKPVSETPEDPFNGWGATIVDALDTLLVMELPTEYDYARQHVRDIDFHLIGGGRSAYASNDGRIPVFETAIRYLGGFLSAYDLSGDTLMKDRAEELAQLILPAFETASGVPVGRIRFDMPHPSSGGGVVLAEAASMLLEMTRLWQVTGNRTYFDRVQRTTDWLDRNMTNTPTRLGTLWPTTIFPDRGTMYGWYTWGGQADSAFEYLIKEHQLLGGQLEQYGRMFGEAVDSARQWLLRPIKTVDETPLLVLGLSNGKTFEPKLEHLACFAGGSLALSGKLLPGRSRDLVHARRFTETCYWAYNSTLTGIGPESCTFYKEKDLDRHAFVYEKDGTSRRGPLNGAPIIGVRSAESDYRNRPETIESVFYLWRTTGDPIWQERGWQMFCSWVTHSMTNVGFSSLGNVFEVPAYQTDSMESFVFAETFKYYYLLFSPPDVMSLDDYVFTTEAHPLLVPQNGVWAIAGQGPRKMWDPLASHTPSDPSAYTGGEMGPVGGLTNAQKKYVHASWVAEVARKETAKQKAKLKAESDKAGSSVAPAAVKNTIADATKPEDIHKG